MKKIASEIRDVIFGNNVTIIEPTNMYKCTLQDDVFVGPFVEIQKGVVIGLRSKIQSHTLVCELVTIGDDCFIGHGVMFTNDTFSSGGPAMGNKNQWKSTYLGNNVSIGSNATILPVKICDDVIIGAGSLVSKDINEPGTYVGNPAKKIR